MILNVSTQLGQLKRMRALPFITCLVINVFCQAQSSRVLLSTFIVRLGVYLLIIGFLEEHPFCRSRYAAEDMTSTHAKHTAETEAALRMQAAAHMMRKLAVLHKKHATRQRGRAGYLPLWND